MGIREEAKERAQFLANLGKVWELNKAGVIQKGMSGGTFQAAMFYEVQELEALLERMGKEGLHGIKDLKK